MTRLSRRLTGALATGTLFAVPLAVLLCAHPAAAQSGAMNNPMLQAKLESLKASVAENQQKLHEYTWTETSRITVNGSAKPPRESMCSYGPDGKVQKVPMGGSAEPAPSGGGRIRQRVVAKKTAEIKDYMKEVSAVLALYLPPNSQKMQQAFQDKRVSTSRSEGMATLVFKDYALPGDSMTISFDSAAKKIQTLSVHSYLNSPSSPVSLQVEFSSLPDGTNYPLRTTLDATGEKINVVSTNTNYRKR